MLLHLQNSVNLEFTSSETLFLLVGEVSCPSSGSAFHAPPVLGMLPFIHNSSENVGLGIYCHRALSGLGIFFAGSLSYFLPAARLLVLQRARGTVFNSEQVPGAPWPWTQAACGLGIWEQLLPLRGTAGAGALSAAGPAAHALFGYGGKVLGTGRTPAALSSFVPHAETSDPSQHRIRLRPRPQRDRSS